MKRLTIKINIEFSDIQENIRTADKRTVIRLKNGDEISITGEQGRRINRVLCKQHSGDHI